MIRYGLGEAIIMVIADLHIDPIALKYGDFVHLSKIP